LCKQLQRAPVIHTDQPWSTVVGSIAMADFVIIPVQASAVDVRLVEVEVICSDVQERERASYFEPDIVL